MNMYEIIENIIVTVLQIDSGQTSAEYVIDWIVTVLSNK